MVIAISKYNVVTYLFHLKIKSRIINLQIKFLKIAAKSRKSKQKSNKVSSLVSGKSCLCHWNYIPAFNKTIWSSCESFMNPGTILANSMICCITVVSFWAHSSQSCSCAMFLQQIILEMSVGFRKDSWICSVDTRHVLACASAIVFERSSLICAGSTKIRRIFRS